MFLQSADECGIGIRAAGGSLGSIQSIADA
jgi:hypothetical protein